MRRVPKSAVSATCLRSRAQRWSAAAYHMPGWKTQSSTKDARTREQREIDRKARQIEKLPRPEALHDFQYPYEKTVLSDSMFEYPVYETELDTPHLFHLTPPPDFFIYWNATDFERTAYPAVPAEDHRLLIPSPQSPRWVEHRARLLRYLRKHEVMPHYVPHVHANVNLSVVFPGQYQTRARRTDENGDPLRPPPPPTSMTPRNFWFTAHCGNYMELTDLQQPPSIFLLEEPAAAGESATASSSSSSGSGGGGGGAAAAEASCYTLVMLSPDYPYRVPMSQDRLRADRGFFLNYMVANLTAPQAAVAAAAGGDAVVESEGLRCTGDVVVPYVAPLPTEDAGTTRHVCLLFKQTRHVPKVRPLTAEEEQRHFPLAQRCNYRLHSSATEAARQHASTSGSPACLASLRAVEHAIPADPSAATFFTTKWDIQVQEYYEKVGLPEPAAPIDEEIEALLEFHAMSSADLRVRARHRPDGSTNMGDDPHFWGQAMPTRMMDGSMQRGSGWSRRTAMGSNGVPVVYPH
ncbi:Phosphatidylethanolamine-binding protein [Novymonas esmeraldas]|uniref:Phosphatidylethanolamine-binding protein n=1 Tax=Novymonas esmeraldas TaxID=1808958 RepID=A0AAW0F3K6_9TRYP